MILVLVSLASAIIRSDLFLPCDGRTLNQSDYPALYAKIGLIPSLTPTLRTVLPTSLVDLAYGVVNGTGYYLGIGSNLLYRSTDAVNGDRVLTAHVVFATTPTAIVYCGGSLSMFVIAAASTTVYTSVDTVTWLPSLTNADATVSYVACSNTTIVVGGAADTDNSIQNVWTSTDGVSWTKVAIAGTGGLTIKALYWSPGYGSGTSVFVLGTSAGAIQTSATGSSWTARTSNIASQINQFALGQTGAAGTLVAVGNSGVISTSLDSGATWTAHTYEVADNIMGVAWSSVASLFVSGATQTVSTSADGQTWTVTIASLSVTKGGIFYGNGLYVTCGQTGLLATSPDLNTWTGRVSVLPTNSWLAGAYGNGTGGPIYVIVGGIIAGSGRILSSPTGVTWTSRTSNAGNNGINYVLFAGGSIQLFIATGNNIIITSPDGNTWTLQTSNLGGAQGNGLAFSGATVVAVGASGHIVSSTTGTTWTARTSPTTQTLNGVAWNGALFCAVGALGVVITSSDGITWTKRVPTGSLETATWNWITGDGVASFYAIQSGTALFISSNCVTWVPYATPFALHSVNWMNNQLVAYSSNNDVAWSPNGQQWTLPANPRGWVLNGKIYTGSMSQFIATQASAGVTTSTDGIRFSQQQSTTFNDVAFSANLTKTVAVGTNGVAMTSTDGGVSWTQIAAFSNSIGAMSINSIAYSPTLGLFVAVTSLAAVYSSPDGVSWTQQIYANAYIGNSPAASFQHVTWSAARSLFVAVGAAGVIATSPDGTTWTTRTSNTFIQLNQVVYNTALGLFVAVGGAASGLGGCLLTSSNGTTWTLVPTSSIGGGTGDVRLFSVGSLEAAGFFALGPNNAALYSADGVTWTQRRVSSEFAGQTVGKMLSAPQDGGVYWFSSSASKSNTQHLVFSDGTSEVGIPTYSGASSFLLQSLAYDSTNDAYVGIGQSGAVVRLARAYNKTSQFVLPTRRGEFVYAGANDALDDGGRFKR